MIAFVCTNQLSDPFLLLYQIYPQQILSLGFSDSPRRGNKRLQRAAAHDTPRHTAHANTGPRGASQRQPESRMQNAETQLRSDFFVVRCVGQLRSLTDNHWKDDRVTTVR